MLQTSLSSLGQGNPSPVPGKSMCSGGEVWKSREDWRRGQGQDKRSGMGEKDKRRERSRVRAETGAEMDKSKERSGVWGQDGTSSLQRLICVISLNGSYFPSISE